MLTARKIARNGLKRTRTLKNNQREKKSERIRERALTNGILKSSKRKDLSTNSYI